MLFTVNCQCPQCGAGLPIDEGQRFIACEFCGAGNFLTNRDLPWLVMPKNIDGERTIFAPYLRCRGPVFTCVDNKIDFRVIDASIIAANLPGAPLTLGVRAQAVSLSFPDPREIGQRLPLKGKTATHLTKMIDRGHGRMQKRPAHQALIGEIMSLVYLPLIIDSAGVRDGSSGEELPIRPEDIDNLSPAGPAWEPIFHAAICPGCGWDLKGGETSQVLFCPNCATAWLGGDDSFARVEVEIMAAKNDASRYLPFWEVTFSLPENRVETTAELEQFLLLPTRGLKNDQRRAAIITPAFKIKPKDFLRLGCQLSHIRPETSRQDTLPGNLHPVSLAAGESVQAIRTILAARAMRKHDFFPLLAKLKPSVQSLKLILLPFTDRGYNFMQKDFNISINRQALKSGRLI